MAGLRSCRFHIGQNVLTYLGAESIPMTISLLVKCATKGGYPALLDAADHGIAPASLAYDVSKTWNEVVLHTTDVNLSRVVTLLHYSII